MAANYDERDYVASEPPHYAEGEWNDDGQPLIRLLIEPHYVVPPDPKSKAGRNPVERREFVALIDTGATRTVIDVKVARELKLRGSYNKDVLCCVGRKSPIRCKSYDVTFTFAGFGRPLKLTDILCAELHQKGVDCLIGLDVLSKGELLIEGTKRSFRYLQINED